MHCICIYSAYTVHTVHCTVYLQYNVHCKYAVLLDLSLLGTGQKRQKPCEERKHFICDSSRELQSHQRPVLALALIFLHPIFCRCGAASASALVIAVSMPLLQVVISCSACTRLIQLPQGLLVSSLPWREDWNGFRGGALPPTGQVLFFRKG